MSTIAKSISGIIQRQMRPVFRQPAGSFYLNIGVAICLAMTVCSGTSFAQKRKQKPKPATPTKKTSSKPALKTQTTAAPELPLERLSDPSVENADLSITAHVRARSLIFETVPNPTVEFSGQPERNTVWEAERENLPTPVQPGVTYRDIGIRLKITSVFRDIDRIVAEALGEIPVTDDKTPATQAASKPIPTAKPAAPDSSPASTPPPPRERP